MRDIRFRGQRKDNGQWVEGHLFHFGRRAFIIDAFEMSEVNVLPIAVKGWIEVIPSTVGQYTGLKDKNGRGSYNADVCEDEFGQKWLMAWQADIAAFVLLLEGRPLEETDCDQVYDASAIADMTIICNIHDNPELLETP